ncbi:MAG: phage tail assembly protein [Pseudomonadota bacterium]
MSDPDIREIDTEWVDASNPTAIVQKLEYPISHKAGPAHAAVDQPIETLTFRRMTAGDYEKFVKGRGETPAAMQCVCDLAGLSNPQLVKNLDAADYARAEAVIMNFMRPFLPEKS